MAAILGSESKPLTSFEAARDEALATYTSAKALLNDPPSVWSAGSNGQAGDGLTAAVRAMASLPGAIRAMAAAETERRAVRLMLALERYRLEARRYPDRLADLVPRQLAAIERDPINGQGWGYRVADDRAAYVLYSFGLDGVDNGGVHDAHEPRAALRGWSGGWNGKDAVMNAPAAGVGAGPK